MERQAPEEGESGGGGRVITPRGKSLRHMLGSDVAEEGGMAGGNDEDDESSKSSESSSDSSSDSSSSSG